MRKLPHVEWEFIKASAGKCEASVARLAEVASRWARAALDAEAGATMPSPLPWHRLAGHRPR